MPDANTTQKLRPWMLGAMTALFVARPLFPSESMARNGDGLAVVLLWILLAACWFLGALFDKEDGGDQRVRFGWIDAAMLALVGWHTVSALFAVWQGSPRPAINMLWLWISFYIAFFLARQLVRTAGETRMLVAVMIGLALTLSVYGFYQSAYELPLARAAFEANPDEAMREAGMWFPEGSPGRELFKKRLEDTSPLATFELTNSLAGFLAPWLVMAAGIALLGCTERIERHPWRWLTLICCITPIAVCLVLTKSRSGLLAACAGVLLAWMICQRNGRPIAWKLPAGVAVVGLLGATAAAATGLLGAAVKSFSYRLEYWQSVLSMIADRPLLGCGPGNFQQVYTRYKLPQASEEIADPHNFIMEVWATAGTPALVALLAVLGCFFWAAWRRVDDDAPEEAQDAKWFVAGGAAVGLMMALPLGIVAGVAPSLIVLLCGVPLTAACILIVQPWIFEGRLPGRLPAVAAAALLINLSVAGGISFAGVCGTLWILMAIGMPRREPLRLHRAVAGLGIAVVMAAAVGCYATAYGPVTKSNLSMQRALAEGRLQVERNLTDAADADPLAATPRSELAAIAFEQWRVSTDEEQFQRFEKYNAEALSLTANSASAWHRAGGMYVDAYRISKSKQHIEKATEALRRTVQLYPNSAQYRADLALALREAGDMEGYRREKEEALRLDEITPHEDKKIAPETRAELLKGSAEE